MKEVNNQNLWNFEICSQESMIYDEFKQLCRKTWDEDYNYLCIDRSKKRDQGRYCICNESKNTYVEFTPQTKAF